MAELPGGIKRTVPLVPTTDRRTPLVNTGALYENINLLDGTPTRKREHYVGDFGRKVSWGELAEASMHIDNDPYNWWKAWEKSRIENEFSWDPEYKVKMEDLVGTPFEDNWDLLLDSNIQSAEHLEFLTDWYTRELEMRERLALGGARTFATSGLAGIVSPISMIPVGAGLKGASLLRGGVRGAGAAFLGAGISETGLHLTQQYRTGTETAFGVTAGVLLGSALGGLAGGLSGRSLRKAHRTTSRLLDSPIPSVVIDHGIYRVATDATRKALEEARHRAIVKEGRPLTDEEFLRIFRETSEEYADEDAITGLYDDELRLFFTTRPLLESDTVVGGSNFALTPDQLRAAAAERQIDAEAWVRFGDAERDIPIESASEEVLTTAQRALLEQLRVRAQAAGDNEELVGQLDDLQADFLERAGAVEEFHRLQQEMNELEVRLRDPEAEPFTEEETFAFLQKRARAIWLRRRIAEALDPDKVSMVEGLMREVGLDPDAVRAGTFGETALRRVWADAIEADADVRGGPAPIFDEQGGFNRGFEPEEATPTPHAAEGAAPTESRVVRDEERVVVSEPTVTRVSESTGNVQTTQVVRIGRHEWTITETTSERSGAKAQTMVLRGVDPETGEPRELMLTFKEGKHTHTDIRFLSGEAEGVTSEAETGKFFFEEPNHENVGLATNARRHTLDDNPNAIFPRVDTTIIRTLSSLA